METEMHPDLLAYLEAEREDLRSRLKTTWEEIGWYQGRLEKIERLIELGEQTDE